MLRLKELRQRLRPFGLTVEKTGRGKHPFKVVGFTLDTGKRYVFPLKIHGRNPEIPRFYLRGLIEGFHLPKDAFD